MGGRGHLIEKVKELWNRFMGDKQHNQKRRYVIIIALIGVLLILLSNMIQPNKQKSDDVVNDELVEEAEEVGSTKDQDSSSTLLSEVSDMEQHYEKSLQTMLNEITGVSEVEIMVNIDSTNVHVYEKDLIVGTQTTEETDKSGGERQVKDDTKETTLVYVRKGDQEVPVRVQTKKPDVRGVFIIAKGADNATIKKWIVESVSKVLDVPTYQVSVMPK